MQRLAAVKVIDTGLFGRNSDAHVKQYHAKKWKMNSAGALLCRLVKSWLRIQPNDAVIASQSYFWRKILLFIFNVNMANTQLAGVICKYLHKCAGSVPQ